MTRAELIKALESLEGPSREMDAEIYAACMPSPPNRYLEANYEKRAGIVGIGPYFGQVVRAEKYTSSIDSALTLGRNEVERRAILGAIYDNANETYTIARCILFGCAHALRLREESTNEEA